MFAVEKIEDFEDARLLPYRTMRRQVDHAEQEIFVAEGEKVVRRLLESNLEVISVLLPQKWISDYEPLICKRRESVAVFTADKPVLERLTGFSFYQGVLGVAKIPQPLRLAEALQRHARPYFFAAVDGLTSAENMGALVRNCVAFGAQALVVSETSCTPYLRRAVRNSMGTVFKLPLIFSQDLAQSLQQLRQNQIRCVAAHPHTDKTIFETDFTHDCCVVFGSEGTGLSKAVMAACDELVAVPMRNEVDSLNVGAAAAVFLFEVARQRAAKK